MLAFRRPKRTRPSTGFTLLELLAASALMVVALVPALQLTRRALELGREAETRNMLVTLGVSKLEEHLAQAAASWTTLDESGSMSVPGHSNLKYHVTRSEDPADGGIADKLMAVEVTAWEDSDGDGAADAGEVQVSFRSKVAKLAMYQDEVQ